MSSYKWEIKWRNVIFLALFHYWSLQAIYRLIVSPPKLESWFFGFLIAQVTHLGVICGAHRYWTHRTFKANLPLRWVMLVCNTMCFQNPIYDWARDHRVHHKFSDTDADPHNINRGFFFAHMGWLMLKKHPDVTTKGKTVDMSDLENDWMVMQQRKYFPILSPLLGMVFPMWLLWYFFDEDWYICFTGMGILRYVLILHVTWSVNSVAHMFGTKPYDTSIKPTENKVVSFLSGGEGWHNYHHSFPWDYRASEFSGFGGSFNTGLIEFFARRGWAYDLKSASPNLILKLKNKNKVDESQEYLNCEKNYNKEENNFAKGVSCMEVNVNVRS